MRVKYSGSDGAFFSQNQGYEYELLLAAAGAALALVGPGRLAFDAGKPWDRHPVRYTATAAGLARRLAAFAAGG